MKKKKKFLIILENKFLKIFFNISVQGAGTHLYYKNKKLLLIKKKKFKKHKICKNKLFIKKHKITKMTNY